MNKIQLASVVALISAGVLTESVLVSSSVAYGLVALSYVFLIASSLQSDIAFRIPSWALLFLSIIWAMYIFHLIVPVLTDQSLLLGQIIRPPTFILFSLVNLFLIPYIVPPEKFLSIIGIMSTILVLVGLPTVFFDYKLLFFEITHDHTMNILGLEIRRITSVFGNPNVAGFLFMIGFIIYCIVYLKQRDNLVFVLGMINLIGLVLTESRAGYLGAVAGILFVAFSFYTSNRQVRIAVWGYFLAIVTGIAVFANVLPRPKFIGPTDLGNRPGLWEGGVESIVNSPLGYGPGSFSNLIESYVISDLVGQGIHSAYLRLFLSTGLLGGLSYMLFIIYSILSVIPEKNIGRDYVIFGVIIGISTKEVFEGNTIFGISMSSILISIIVGYAISVSHRTDINLERIIRD